MTYRFIDHTADIGIHVVSGDVQGLFEDAAQALVDIMGAGCKESSHKEEISVKGIDRIDVLVRWLQEILYLMEVRGWRLRDAHVEELGETEVKGVLQGACVQEPLTAEIKAVTYHNLKIVHTGDVFEVTIILDM